MPESRFTYSIHTKIAPQLMWTRCMLHTRFQLTYIQSCLAATSSTKDALVCQIHSQDTFNKPRNKLSMFTFRGGNKQHATIQRGHWKLGWKRNQKRALETSLIQLLPSRWREHSLKSEETRHSLRQQLNPCVHLNTRVDLFQQSGIMLVLTCGKPQHHHRDKKISGPLQKGGGAQGVSRHLRKWAAWDKH